MKRPRRAPGGGPRHHGRRPRRSWSRHLLLGCAVLLTGTCVSVASADEGTGRPPLGVTRTAPPSPRTARVGVLLDGDGDDDGDSGGGGGGGRHFCTASVVHSPRHDLIVTAAHCVDGGGPLWFAPGYRDGAAPYGVWKVRNVLYDDAWAEGADEDHDLAFAVLDTQDAEDGEDGGGRGVEDVVGAGAFPTGPPHDGRGGGSDGIGIGIGVGVVTVVGYPDARETPIACTARPVALGLTQQRVDCPGFTGGTSGSPWVDRAGEVVGVIGGHEEGGATADVSYSVVVGEDAWRLYRTAMAQL
ncbi:serine protease [Streptomyces sp. B3I8]|uniref:trypsin-like serine peptidase n=1 Tax=Streptomyces sp. B3I8 TaxID=3042303 RepID=UPI002787C925|nr:trypsin-like peptidase domain-containing protein [Streptomyces sp. B3I8]MDQ0787837.1 hypothetical protein [Streptomyces sp. B3I8]